MLIQTDRLALKKANKGSRPQKLLLSLTMLVAESPLAPSPRIAVNASQKSPVEIPFEVKGWKQGIDAGSPPHVLGQNRTGKAPLVPMADPWLMNWNRTRSTDHLPFRQMAIAYDQLFPRPRRVPQIGTLANRQTMKSIPYSPMVCVKLPKTVLVIFIFLEQRSCQFVWGSSTLRARLPVPRFGFPGQSSLTPKLI